MGRDRRLGRVDRIRRTDAGRVADLVRQQAPKPEHQTASRAVDDLVVIAEFRDPIYPGLVSTGRVERGGDWPFHAVINAEKFHALQVLLYTHEGKIDAICIDPPYNSGARDWKYNNDYASPSSPDSEQCQAHDHPGAAPRVGTTSTSPTRRPTIVSRGWKTCN